MGSYVQVVVGGMLLITAFLFGRYINDKPILPGSVTTAENEEPNLAKPLDLNIGRTETKSKEQQPAEQALNSNNQLSLRDRILGERKKVREGMVQKQFPKIENQEGFNLLPEKLVGSHESIRPDFSNFESEKNDAELSRSAISPPDNPFQISVAKKKALLPNQNHFRMPPRDAIADAPKTIQGALQQKNPTKNTMVPVRSRRNVKATSAREYVNHKTSFGDTLHSLSNQYFGKPDYYLDIYLANKELFDNPSSVPMNVTLKIPVVDELSIR
ncbi:MAG: hypothetical protein AAGA30_10935 [Planctomycetota bacterium]